MKVSLQFISYGMISSIFTTLAILIVTFTNTSTLFLGGILLGTGISSLINILHQFWGYYLTKD